MGNSLSVDGRAAIHTFTSSKSWIEGEATRQLAALSVRPHVKAVAGMPDLHPGKYGPVGCAVLADRIMPELVGSDIGCGMALFQLDADMRRFNADKAAERLRVLGEPWGGDTAVRLGAFGLRPGAHDAALGSIGGGNHFCELQSIAEIVDRDAAAEAGIDARHVLALVHSGSRGLGAELLMQYVAGGLVALDPASAEGAAYLAAHDAAVGWARLNRAIIAERAAAAMKANVKLVADVPHNLAEVTPNGVLHRKGAAPADRGLVAVAGSRGTLSYLVMPTAAARPEALASIAHGAGRKHDRRSMHGRAGTNRSQLEALARNPFGGRVVCEDRAMLIEEAPDAYKAIERVIGDLEMHGLVRVVATLKPLVTFKSVQPAERREKTRHRERDFVDKRDRADGPHSRSGRDREDWR